MAEQGLPACWRAAGDGGGAGQRFGGVGGGEDGAFGVVEDAGGDRAEEEFAEAGAAVGGHDDEVDAVGLGEVDDFGDGVADFEIAVDGDAFEGGGLIAVQLALQLLRQMESSTVRVFLH